MRTKRRARKQAPVKAEVSRATLAEAEAFFALRYEHHIAKVDGQPMAMGTLLRVQDKLWGYLDVREGMTPAQRRAVLFAAVRGLRTISEPVYVTSNEGVNPRALKLLRALGFTPTGETINGVNIWVYTNG